MFVSTLLAFSPMLYHAGELADQLPLSEHSIEIVAETSTQEFHNMLDQFLGIPMEERTFDNTVRFLDSFQGKALQATYCLNMIRKIHPEKKMRDSAADASQKLNKSILEAFSKHPEIYQCCLATDTDNLEESKRYFLHQMLSKLRSNGIQLPDKERALFTQTQQEISDLKVLFDRHAAEDTPLFLASTEELAGLPGSWISSQKQNEQGLYEIGIDLPAYTEILSYCSVQKTRKTVYELFNNRSYPQNEELAVQLIEKRKNLANLVGFPNYAAYDLSFQMAGSTERVETFLKEMKEAIAVKTAQNFALVTENLPEGVSLTSSGQLKRFDEQYVHNQYKKAHLAVDQNLIAEYFPVDKTIDGLIGVYEQFFSLSIQKAPHSLPIPDMLALEIKNPDGKLLGIVLLDLFSREGKCSHVGVCSPLLFPYSPPEGPDYPALTLLICNLTKPPLGAPALMKHGDVINFLHEFGHAIHTVLARHEFYSFCGMSVKQDFIEVPSLLLENWVWDPLILKQVSSHYLSGAPLSDELIELVIQAKNLERITRVQRMIFLSELSLAFFKNEMLTSPTELMQQIWARELPLSNAGDNNHFHNSWWHFSNYGPGYYSYLWSEVLAADLFEMIYKQGLLNPEVGAKYIDAILSKGGSRDPEEMLTDFLGRKPSIEPFFKQLDIHLSNF